MEGHNKKKDAQFEYLKDSLPVNYTFSLEHTGKNEDGVDGIVYYNTEPCALVIYSQNASSEEQKDKANRLLRMYDMPYALVFYEDSWKFFIRESEEIIEKGRIQTFLETVASAISEKCESFNADELVSFMKDVKELCRKYELSDELCDFINKQATDDLIHQIEISKFEKAWNFVSDFEQDFITALVGRCPAKSLCRYTTLNSLFRMLSSGKMSMCGIACMNDKSECYYVDQYLKKKCNRSISEFSLDEIRMLNSYFILSCSEESLEDHLLMWRMYADEATGVCLKYNVDEVIKPYYLAKVSYARKDSSHPELDFIRDILKLTIRGRRFRFKNFTLWKHFFKQYEYKDEHEVRLLYSESDTSKYKWIKTSDQIVCPIVEFGESEWDAFPLTLTKIILGPKSPENETNVSQLQYLLDCACVKKQEKTKVVCSKISSYR